MMNSTWIESHAGPFEPLRVSFSHRDFVDAQALSFQQTRTYAEKSVAVDFDWDEIGKLVHSEEGKRELASLRSTVFDIQSRFEAATKKVPTIDWESWKKQIDPAVVESFKKAFECESYACSLSSSCTPSSSFSSCFSSHSVKGSVYVGVLFFKKIDLIGKVATIFPLHNYVCLVLVSLLFLMLSLCLSP